MIASFARAGETVRCLHQQDHTVSTENFGFLNLSNHLRRHDMRFLQQRLLRSHDLARETSIFTILHLLSCSRSLPIGYLVNNSFHLVKYKQRTSCWLVGLNVRSFGLRLARMV
eukprot:SAG31_NODE_967_length_10684_cov_58.582239_4_plen_113_part_00